MRVHQYDISDVLSFLPEIQALQEEDLCAGNPNLFICALGFEQRTSSIFKRLAQAGALKTATILLICYPTNQIENRANLTDFEESSSMIEQLIMIDYSQASFAQEFTAFLDSLDTQCSVIFDISTCASYIFYPVMREVANRNYTLSLVYAEAEIYYPTHEEWIKVENQAQEERQLFPQSFEDANFLSSGVADVYPYSVFSERNSGNRAGSLVAVPSFSAARMGSIIARDRELNKTDTRKNVVWIIGTPPGEGNKWREEAVKTTNDLGSVLTDNLFYACTFNYKDILEVLEGIWLQRRYTSHLSIGSLGSKMQHVGIFFFLFLHQEVGIWLAEPSEFRAHRFTEGVGNHWLIKIGQVRDLRIRLATYMKFEWTW